MSNYSDENSPKKFNNTQNAAPASALDAVQRWKFRPENAIAQLIHSINQYDACTPLTERFFIHGIMPRKRAPTFSMLCCSPFFSSALYFL